MIIRVLGSAAGGGFPQWNCACENCASVRKGQDGFRARTQVQIAVRSERSSEWHLFGGSPDLRQQLLAYPDMLPSPASPRLSPIASMTLTNADVDATLGLLLMRESNRIRVYSSGYVRAAILEGNAYFSMLKQTDGQCDWRTIESQFELEDGLSVSPVALGGTPPFWARDRFPGAVDTVLGFVTEDRDTGARLGFFPSVARVDESLLARIATCDAIFIDGTFWDEDELPRLKGGTRGARAMGHIPMSGSDGSIEALASLPTAVKKYFIHINNTNPALNEFGEQHLQLKRAGWELAHDGMEIRL